MLTGKILVAIATGADATGSLRYPASACGILTLKPTTGRIPSEVPAGGSDPIGAWCDFVLARSARDLAAVFMIATGAYWANRTWGSYWSWDPKETWAAITWLVYAGYLHMRITRGWRGRRAAYFAILGFGVVIFTFLGVTYLLPGLHAYA